MQLSANFNVEEFQHSQTATRLGIDNTVPADLVQNLAELCMHVLEPIRLHVGPIHIDSGYRCPDLNMRIGGAHNSQHLHGEAADILCSTMTPLELCKWIQQSGIVVDQCIAEGSWCHVSWASSGVQRGQFLTAHFSSTSTTYTEGLG